MEDLRFQTRTAAAAGEARRQDHQGQGQGLRPPQIAAYYEKNKSQFARPETPRPAHRPDEGQGHGREGQAGDRDRRQLEPRSPRSTRPTTPSKSQGGKLGGHQGPAGAGVRRRGLRGRQGQADRPDQDAVRLLRRRRSTRSRRPRSSRWKEATPTIKQVLASQDQQKALDDFGEDYRKKWTEKTDCRNGYVIQGCKNAPEADDDRPRRPAGATPQPAPPHGRLDRRRRDGPRPRTGGRLPGLRSGVSRRRHRRRARAPRRR